MKTRPPGQKTQRSSGRPARDGLNPECSNSAIADRLTHAVSTEIERLVASPLAAGLYLVSTPIGNIGDISLRAAATIFAVDKLYCEDTRHSRKLLDRLAIRRDLASYHEHNADRVRPSIIAEIAAGRSVALISDAGTPLVSDPGFKLVRDTLDAGLPVRTVPGPSAVIAGLSISGLAGERFFFEGFLAPKSPRRRARLAEIAGIPGSIVLYEAPGRLAAMLGDAADILGGRQAVIARELTKLHEEVVRGTLCELRAWAEAGSPRGEFVVVIAPAGRVEISDARIVEALQGALRDASLRDAVHDVAARLGVARNRVYRLALEVAGQRGGGEAGS